MFWSRRPHGIDACLQFNQLEAANILNQGTATYIDAAPKPPCGTQLRSLQLTSQTIHESTTHLAMTKVLGFQDISADDIIIALMGPTGVGKSTFINAATGRDGRTISHKLGSCTLDIQAVRCSHPKDGRPIVFVDTPGFDNTYKSDTEILKMIADWLETMYENNNKLAGIIYMHRISDNRMAGTPLKNLRMFANLCGDDACKNVILATTMWELVEGDEGERRLDQLKGKYWKGMLEKGSTVARFESQTFEAAWSVVNIITEKQSGQQGRSLLLQEEMFGLKKQLSETQAGITLYGTLQKLLAEQRDTIRQLRDEARLQNNPQLVEDLNAQYEMIAESLRKTADQAQKMETPAKSRLLTLFKSKMVRTRSIQIP